MSVNPPLSIDSKTLEAAQIASAGGYNFPEPETNNGSGFMNSVNNTISGLKSKFGLGGGFVSGIALNVSGDKWPQTQRVNDFKESSKLREMYPDWQSTGFLPPILCSPKAKEVKSEEDKKKTQLETKKIGGYIYQDWRGHIIAKKTGVDNPAASLISLDTTDRFNLSLPDDLPRKNRQDLANKPYSTRDLLSIFGDYSTEYFKHGLQVIDNVGTLPPNLDDYYKSGQNANYKKTTFNHTPFENNDPVIFGFEIVFDDINSPLLNGSVSDFLNLLGNVSEIRARQKVYEEFKYQFTKFFKTRATVRYDEEQLSITKSRNFGSPETEKNQKISESGKKSYMSYYLKTIAGLEKLVESNTPTEKNYIADYNKDVITLTFNEDISASIGTLAHLYKLLYWSKPNGKGMVPENLLRFNCDIIISEVRNFARIKKSGNNLETIKDNVSRYIYSLRECQFYFNTVPHDPTIDLSQPKTFDAYSIQFDYKYSALKFERFVPVGNTGQGKYVGYDSGAIWKIGNAGERENRTNQIVNLVDSSVPKFFTDGQNKYNQSGVTEPIVIKLANSQDIGQLETIPPQPVEGQVVSENPTPDEESKQGLKNFKESSKKFAKAAADRTTDAVIAATKTEFGRIKGQARRSLLGLLGKVTGINGISPPKNVYNNLANTPGGRIFYDVRGQLINFAGDALGDFLSRY
jgi:hypothetical protein